MFWRSHIEHGRGRHETEERGALSISQHLSVWQQLRVAHTVLLTVLCAALGRPARLEHLLGLRLELLSNVMLSVSELFCPVRLHI